MRMKRDGSHATKINLRGEIERVGDASKYLAVAGQAVIVNRGCLRSIVFSCPDGCGETLTINLDPRAGKAWRLYRTRFGLTIFPSIWRDNGCRSHFIVWRDHILWCGLHINEDTVSSPMDAPNSELDASVLKALRYDRTRSYVEIADEIAEVPWDVLSSCNRLVTQRKAQRGLNDEKNHFKLV